MFFICNEARYRVGHWSVVETLGGMVGALWIFSLKCLNWACLSE